MKFCFLCGKETENLIKGYCEECYNKKFKLIEVPKRISITVCSKCNRKKQKNKWEDLEVDDIIKEKIKLLGKDINIKTIKNDVLKIHAKGYLKESKELKEETHIVKPIIKRKVCPICSRRFGGYYESVLQLRGNITHDVVNFVKKEVFDEHKRNEKAFYRIKKAKGGFDLFFGNKPTADKIARLLSKKYKSKIKRSFKLTSRREGKNIYRNIILVRIR